MFELEPIDFPVKNAFLQNQILIIYIQLIFLCMLQVAFQICSEAQVRLH